MDDYRVVITRSAFSDLKRITSYIRDDLKEPATAKKLLEKFKVSIMSLAIFPLRHNLVTDGYLTEEGFRRIIVDDYIIFYIVSERDQIVTVVRILYGKRDWVHLL